MMRLLLPRCLMVVLGLAALAPLASPGQPSGGPADESTVVKVLLIIDSEDPTGAGQSFVKDAEIIEKLLTDGFAKFPERLKIDKLAGKDCTPAKVTQYYNIMKADASATLAAFYFGHGATEKSAGAVLGFGGAGGKEVLVRRAALRDAMLSKHPRLVVLLSNTCAGPLDLGKRPVVADRPDWQTMRHLFLVPRGVVDINSVSEGEYASLSTAGSPYIIGFDETLRQPFATLDVNKDGFLHWQEILPRLQKKSQDGFLVWRQEVITQFTALLKVKDLKDEERKQVQFVLTIAQEQKYQTLRVFSLPPLHRLGLRVLDHKDGAQVLFVYDDTPAATAGFKSGDVIRAIGGQKITSAKDYADAVAKSKGKVAVEVMRGDAAVTMDVILAPWAHAGTDG
jgi:hypothetical protein